MRRPAPTRGRPRQTYAARLSPRAGRVVYQGFAKHFPGGVSRLAVLLRGLKSPICSLVAPGNRPDAA